MPSSRVSNTWPPLSDTWSPSPIRSSHSRQSRLSTVGCSSSTEASLQTSQGSSSSRSGAPTGISSSGNSLRTSHSGGNTPSLSNTAQSNGSWLKSTWSTSIQALVSCTSLPGCRCRKRLRHASNQRMVRVEGAFMRSMSSSPHKVSQARSNAAKPSRTPGSSTRPASVSCRLRPLRTNRRQAKCSSSVRICRLMALWVMDSSSPARVKELSRAAASNARKAYSGGSWRGMRHLQYGRVRQIPEKPIYMSSTHANYRIYPFVQS